jgi:hypothetical protein
MLRVEIRFILIAVSEDSVETSSFVSAFLLLDNSVDISSLKSRGFGTLSLTEDFIDTSSIAFRDVFTILLQTFFFTAVWPEGFLTLQVEIVLNSLSVSDESDDKLSSIVQSSDMVTKKDRVCYECTTRKKNKKYPFGRPPECKYR